MSRFAGRPPRALLILAFLVAFSSPASPTEVSPAGLIFRTPQLDYAVSNPGANHSSEFAVPALLDARLALGREGVAEILVYNDPCAGYGSPAVLRISPRQGGVQARPQALPPGGECRSDAPRGDLFTAADFDGNGRLDFASWRASRVYLQQDSGEFTAHPFSLPLDPIEGYPGDNWLVAGDLNQDGKPDVVVSQFFLVINWDPFDIRSGTNLYVFLADGAGGFVRTQKISSLPGPGLEFELVPARLDDFTGDGTTDLLARGTGPQGRWEILPGDGAGHLAHPSAGIGIPSLPPLSGSGTGLSEVLTAGDLNLDGLPDLILRSSPPSVAMSAGPAQFRPALLLTGAFSAWEIQRVSITEVNGDPWPDIQVFVDREVWTFPGRPSGELGPPEKLRLPFLARGGLRMLWDEDSLTDTVYYGVPRADYQGQWNLTVRLAAEESNRDRIVIAPPWNQGVPAAVGDFDGDGEQDLVFVRGAGPWGPARLVVFRGNGRGGFEMVPDGDPPPSSGIAAVQASDLNRDGRDDLVLLSPPPTPGGSGLATIFLGQPPGHPPVQRSALPTASNPMKAAVADLNGDAVPDLIVADAGALDTRYTGPPRLDGTVSTYLGRGDGAFESPRLALPDPSPYRYLGLADLQVGEINGDGRTDILLLFGNMDGASSPTGTWADGQGDGTFTFPYSYHHTLSSQISSLLPPLDLNGDGRVDLAFANGTVPNVARPFGYSSFGIFLGHDEEDFSRFVVGSDCCYNGGQFIDFDQDGFLDLIGFTGLSSRFSVARGSGAGNFDSGSAYFNTAGSELLQSRQSFRNRPATPLFGDFDDDGRVDLLVYDSEATYLLLNRANRVASDAAESLADPAAAGPPIDPGIDLREIQGRVGAFDYGPRRGVQGALILTLALNDWAPADYGESTADRTAGKEGAVPAGRRTGALPLFPRSAVRGLPGRPLSPKLKAGTFQIHFNFGEPLMDSDGDGTLERSLANALVEPGLAGFPLADATFTLRLDGGGPAFTGMRNIEQYSSVDTEGGLARFVIPFQDLLNSMTPAERQALDQGDGTGRIFLWAVGRLNGQRDRMPDTDDGGDPTIRSEVREFRFPLRDLRVTPQVTFGDTLLTTESDGPFTVANHGILPVEVTGVTLPDPTLSLPGSTPFTVPPLGRRQFELRFAPTHHARLAGQVILTLDDPGTPEIRTTPTGRGVAPVVRVSVEGELDFGSLPVGFVSPVGPGVRIENTGDASLYGWWDLEDPDRQFSLFDGGYFPPWEDRGLDLYPGESGTFWFYFVPRQVGPSRATLRIQTNDPLEPEIVIELRGSGTPPEPRLTLGYQFPLAFGWIASGGESTREAWVKNSGSSPLHITSVSSSDPQFTVAIDRTILAPQELAGLSVTLRPTRLGEVNTNITLVSDDPTRPVASTQAYGYVFEAPPRAEISTTQLDFGPLHQGDSATRSFAMANHGAGRLNLTGADPLLDPSCAFTTDLALPATVLPGETRLVNVTFTADLDRYLCPELSFETNDPAYWRISVVLQASILSPRVVLPPSLLFPSTAVGTVSSVDLTIGNSGQDTLRITGATADGAPFGVADSPLEIPVGGTGVLRLFFRPPYPATFSGTLRLSTNDLENRTVYLGLFGSGVAVSGLKAPTVLP